MTANLADLLDGLPHAPSDVAVVCDDERISLAELKERVAELADVLRSAGVVAGQPVGMFVGHGSAAVVAMFAVWKVGAVYVPMNRRSTVAEIQKFIGDTPTALVIGEPTDLAMHELPMGRIAYDFAARRAELLAPADPEVVNYGEDVALVLRTSGTTGRPKAVLLRHVGTIEGFDSSLSALRGKPKAGADPNAPKPLRFNLIPVSLALWAGIWNTLFSLRAGFGLLLMDKFDAVKFAGLVKEFGIKSTIMPPAMVTMLVDDPNVTDLAPLTMVRSITAPLSPVQAREFHKRFGAFVLNCYGQTELGSEVVGWTAKDVREFGETKLGAAGRPYATVVLKILLGDGTEAGVDEYGEIMVHSPFMMEGYASGGSGSGSAAVAASDRIVDGFLRTGDMGRLDAEGFLWVEGRVSDMINRGGNKIFPDEVEEVLRRHPNVRDAAVAGVPDRRLGEVPHAWIVLAEPRDEAALSEELVTWVRESLVPYKIPVGFTVIDALPRNEIGKVLRKDLIASYAHA
ncbi:MAG TPA: class I adenylate-forming enzyme family protein [Jatrophihabitans sp.]